METAAGGFAALGEAVVFLSHFKDLQDPRQPASELGMLRKVNCPSLHNVHKTCGA
jgi:hypothetical protein